jgi:outer membrane protein assembly factor BamB
MTTTQTADPIARRPLRLWPGVVFATLVLLAKVAGTVVPGIGMYGMLGSVVGALLILLWWLLFSRAPWLERLGALALMAAALYATGFILHKSIAGGAMGFLFPMLAIPILAVAFVASLVATRRLADGPRRLAIAGTILLACGSWALIRTGGFTGEGDNDFAWRWSQTPEEKLLAAAANERLASVPPPAAPAAEAPAVPAPEPAAVPSTVAVAEAPKEAPAGPEPAAAAAKPAPTRAQWPGFRGPARDGVVRGVRIETDWSASPPVEMWRRPIGPGWSSFAVRGDLLYTQEQRGDEEVVAAYHLATGEPVWRHRDAARFYESNGGAGPRGTPTISGGRVYTLGATGIVNVLDAVSGAVVWSRNAAADTQAKVPGWGFSSSPLVVDDVVIVATGGKLVAYDAATGNPRWSALEGKGGYSSPHLATIDGVVQVLFLNEAGVTSFAPADGKVLWKHSLPAGNRIVQPALTADGDVLMNEGDGSNLHRIALERGPDGWTSQDRWSSMGLKPNFNDLVVHEGHAYGFDGSILACIDLADGTRKWKGGRYGHGQLVLLHDQDLLLVLSEEGEVALVGATPDQHQELARRPAIEGKTWNHPALAGDVLLVRNGEEMAAFKLALASR